MSSSFSCTMHGTLAASVLATTSDLLTRAFLADPYFCCVQPSERWRQRGLPTLFRALLRDAAGRGGVVWNAESALAWSPVAALRATFWEHAFRGYAAVPVRLGLKASLRLQAHEDWCTQRLEALSSKDAAYVHSVGVEPNLAGRGIGSKLMNAGLERIDERYPECILRTEQPRNVRFYEKLGFRCVEHLTAPVTNLPVWFFLRPASTRTIQTDPA